jgi:hypothetical protein
MQAGVVHMDLRPANIMYRPVQSGGMLVASVGPLCPRGCNDAGWPEAYRGDLHGLFDIICILLRETRLGHSWSDGRANPAVQTHA